MGVLAAGGAEACPGAEELAAGGAGACPGAEEPPDDHGGRAQKDHGQEALEDPAQDAQEKPAQEVQVIACVRATDARGGSPTKGREPATRVRD